MGGGNSSGTSTQSKRGKTKGRTPVGTSKGGGIRLGSSDMVYAGMSGIHEMTKYPEYGEFVDKIDKAVRTLSKGDLSKKTPEELQELHEYAQFDDIDPRVLFTLWALSEGKDAVLRDDDPTSRKPILDKDGKTIPHPDFQKENVMNYPDLNEDDSPGIENRPGWTGKYDLGDKAWNPKTRQFEKKESPQPKPGA